MSKNSEKNTSKNKNTSAKNTNQNQKKDSNKFSFVRWFWYLIIVSIVVAFWINAAQNSQLAPIFWAWSWTIEIVNETEDLSLNQWLDHYQSWDFKKINVMDRTQAALFAIRNNLVDIF